MALNFVIGQRVTSEFVSIRQLLFSYKLFAIFSDIG